MTYDNFRTTYVTLFYEIVLFYKTAKNESRPKIDFNWTDQFGSRELFWFPLLTLIWLIVRRICVCLIFPKVVLWKTPQWAASRVNILAENLWDLMASVFVSGLIYKYVAMDYDFLQNPSQIWNDYKLDSDLLERDFWTYLVVSTYFIHSLAALCIYERRNNDFYTLLVHHILTASGAVLFYVFRLYHLAMLSACYMKPSSLPLIMRRILVTCKKEELRSLFCATETLLLVSYALIWFWLRLYLFPLKSIHVAVYFPVLRRHLLGDCPHMTSIVSLLLSLLLLNILWFINILKLVYLN